MWFNDYKYMQPSFCTQVEKHLCMYGKLHSKYLLVEKCWIISNDASTKPTDMMVMKHRNLCCALAQHRMLNITFVTKPNHFGDTEKDTQNIFFANTCTQAACPFNTQYTLSAHCPGPPPLVRLSGTGWPDWPSACPSGSAPAAQTSPSSTSCWPSSPGCAPA